MKPNIVFLNNKLIPQNEARINSFDLGFFYGYGLFETMRAVNSVIFQLDSHLERLFSGQALLNIPLVFSADTLKQACYQVLDANKLSDCRIRITLSAGQGMPHPNAHVKKPVLLINAVRYTPPSKEIYKIGYRTLISSIKRPSPPLSLVKSTNYLSNLLARKEATNKGFQEAVMLNEQGRVASGSSANIFIMKKDVFYTPSLESGALPGITRAVVLNLIKNAGYPFKEKKLTLIDLFEADEAFFTNSLIGIMPISHVDRRKLRRLSGEVTTEITDAYFRLQTNL
ncbi:aminotransferase class IV [Thermoproteota archaeon]